MLNPTAQRNAGIFAVTLSLLAGGSLKSAAAQTPTTPPPATTPVTPPATTPAAAPAPPATTPAAPPATAPPTAPPPAPTLPQQVRPAPGRTPVAPPMRKAPVVKMAPNVVAIVDGTSITRDDVLGMFEMVHGRSVVNQLIQIKALQAEAKRQNVTVTPAEISAAVQKIKDDVVKRQYDSGQGPMEFGEIAKEQGFTPTYIEWNAYLDTLRTKTFEKSISAQIPPLAGQIKVAHILLATIPLDKQGTDVKPTSAADQEAKDAAAKTKIETILADIRAGRITFENAAKQYSDDKSNSGEGGELPYAAKGTFDPGFETAAFTIPKVGDVVGPIKSQFGWHLIKLIAIGKDAPPAEQAAYRAQEIAQVMKNPQSMQYWFNQVVQKAKISINPDPVLVPSPKSPLTGLNLPAPPKTFSK